MALHRSLDLPLDLLNMAVPRYTSYPTAPVWQPLVHTAYEERLKILGANSSPLSLYVHIPFCHSMCLFCGCSVILNRLPEKEEEYVRKLCQEIELVKNHIGVKKEAVQLHFGGGTPTKLTERQLEQIVSTLSSAFSLREDAEIAIEVDPRTVVHDEGKKLAFLKRLGFRRISFGVQDLNEKVQEAVRRRQSREVTVKTYHMARQLGFDGINIDLIYGLPYQNCKTFEETIRAIIELAPDRIALFSYAKIHWMKAHQKAIKDETLPSTEEKFAMYAMARQLLIESGYVAIGMDHFARPHDEMARCYLTKALRRNFQGYTVWPAEDLIGFGVTSIGHVEGAYFQNVKELSEYYQAIDERRLPTFRGKILSSEDRMRRWVIERLMCDFVLDKRVFQEQFGLCFDETFVKERRLLEPYFGYGFLEDSPDVLRVLGQGELFIRNISCCFDAYFMKSQQTNFSRAI